MNKVAQLVFWLISQFTPTKQIRESEVNGCCAVFLISQIWCTVAHGNCMTGIRSGLRKQKLIKWITCNIDSVKYPIHHCIRHGVLNWKTMVYALSIINIRDPLHFKWNGETILLLRFYFLDLQVYGVSHQLKL